MLMKYTATFGHSQIRNKNEIKLLIGNSMESYEMDTLVLFLTYHWPPTGHTNGSLGECKVG